MSRNDKLFMRNYTMANGIGIYHPSKDVVVNHWNNRID
jgi:hypothetical protein